MASPSLDVAMYGNPTYGSLTDAIGKQLAIDMDNAILESLFGKYKLKKGLMTTSTLEFQQVFDKEVEKTIQKGLMTLKEQLTPDRIIFNPPATIVYWKDGTKTIVKTMEGDEFNQEAGFAMAVMRKVFGTRNEYLHLLEKAYVQPKPKKEDLWEEIQF
jgi:hypothetical protein